MSGKFLSGFRQPQPSVDPVEKVQAELILQLPDRIGDGRLRNMNDLRSLRNTAVFAHRMKVLEL